MMEHQLLDPESRILHCARIEFVAKGLQGARMQAIADSAGVNKALLHYYFRSKEQLYDRALSSLLETLWSGIAGELSNLMPDSTFEDRVRIVVRSYLQTLSNDPMLSRFLMREMVDGGQHLPQVVAKVAPLIQKIGAAMHHGLISEIQSGHFEPIEIHHFLFNLIGMILIPYLAGPMFKVLSSQIPLPGDLGPEFAMEREEVIVQTLIHGLIRRKP